MNTEEYNNNSNKKNSQSLLNQQQALSINKTNKSISKQNTHDDCKHTIIKILKQISLDNITTMVKELYSITSTNKINLTALLEVLLYKTKTKDEIVLYVNLLHSLKQAFSSKANNTNNKNSNSNYNIDSSNSSISLTEYKLILNDKTINGLMLMTKLVFEIVITKRNDHVFNNEDAVKYSNKVKSYILNYTVFMYSLLEANLVNMKTMRVIIDYYKDIIDKNSYELINKDQDEKTNTQCCNCIKTIYLESLLVLLRMIVYKLNKSFDLNIETKDDKNNKNSESLIAYKNSIEKFMMDLKDKYFRDNININKNNKVIVSESIVILFNKLMKKFNCIGTKKNSSSSSRKNLINDTKDNASNYDNYGNSENSKNDLNCICDIDNYYNNEVISNLELYKAQLLECNSIKKIETYYNSNNNDNNIISNFSCFNTSVSIVNVLFTILNKYKSIISNDNSNNISNNNTENPKYSISFENNILINYYYEYLKYYLIFRNKISSADSQANSNFLLVSSKEKEELNKAFAQFLLNNMNNLCNSSFKKGNNSNNGKNDYVSDFVIFISHILFYSWLFKVLDYKIILDLVYNNLVISSKNGDSLIKHKINMLINIIKSTCRYNYGIYKNNIIGEIRLVVNELIFLVK